ncbi:hypothetical protein D3C76_1736550 [compost metagenome]
MAEERIVVYRSLISSLMTETQYTAVDPRGRHVLSEFINSIFDVDKMLYFVAPDWWKPRQLRARQFLSPSGKARRLGGDQGSTEAGQVR